MTRQHNNTFRFLIPQITGNEIGDDGCSAIAKALEINTSLTKIKLELFKAQHRRFHFSHFLKSQTIKLEPKEGEPLVKHLRETLHLLNLVFHVIQQYFSIITFSNHME